LAVRYIRKTLKITGFIIGILAVLLFGFHLWFRAHAKGIIEDLVESRSKGKINLKIEKLRFGYFSNKIEIDKAVFVNTDTSASSRSYRFSIDKLKMKGKGLIPLLFSKELLIDTLSLSNPVIEVNRIKETDIAGERKDISIPEEMGKIYSSIQDAIEVLQVKKFKLENATFILANKAEPGQKPVYISNLQLDIDNLKVDSSRARVNEKVFFSDNIVLKTNNQDITFPNGRHKLSFRSFRINLKNKLVEFDSCTIAAIRTDSTSSSFNVFFDALMMTSIDFDTLYRHEVIKADSVYCVNPKFNLEAITYTKNGLKKKPPKLENIIQQLTGDLDLNHVVVANADFNILTKKDGVPNTFVFSKNNFEMNGLSINKNAEKPFKVKSFSMAIRNYENFIKDSTYSIQFDSILFRNDNLILSRFVFNKLNKGKITNTFSIPQFNLSGLSWDDLVFERTFKADAATMYNPYIHYTITPEFKKRRTLFQSLAAVNEYMDLKQLDVVDGTVDLTLKDDLKILLHKATFSVSSQSLLSSTRLAGIRNSLGGLFFKYGSIQSGKMKINLKGIRYNGSDGSLRAGNINVMSTDEDLNISLSDVQVKELQVYEFTGDVYANGVSWENGLVNLRLDSFKQDQRKLGSLIDIINVNGKNTTVKLLTGKKIIQGTLNKLFVKELISAPANKLVLEGLAFAGNELQINGNSTDITVHEFDFIDEKTSAISHVKVKHESGKLVTDISIPEVKFRTHIKSVLNNELLIDELHSIRPVIITQVLDKETNTSNRNKPFTPILINDLRIEQPEVFIFKSSKKETPLFEWKGKKNEENNIQLKNIKIFESNATIENLSLAASGIKFMKTGNKLFSTGDAFTSGNAGNTLINYGKSKAFEWSTVLNNFYCSNLLLDSLGKNNSKLFISSISLNNLHVSSGYLKKWGDLTAANLHFGISQFTGRYSSANDEIRWHNAGYNRNTKAITLDSVSYKPAMDRDSFIAGQTYQVDYMTVGSGAISIGPVDINRFIKKNELVTNKATIKDFYFTDYKDKRLPFNAGVIKPLPVRLLKTIGTLIIIDTAILENAAVEYTEIMDTTKKILIVPLTRMDARILNLKNFDVKQGDSLDIRATGYLLDTIWVKLNVKQSYIDPLEGFLMTLKAKPADLRLLNPIFVPAASMKLESGHLDTMLLRIAGREYIALGEIQLFYHDLKINLLEDGQTNKKTFGGSIKNFIANNFVIRKNNKSRTSPVIYIRNRDKSAINYLVRIVMTGFQSSIGAKNFKKQMKKHRHELQKRQLPPLEVD